MKRSLGSHLVEDVSSYFEEFAEAFVGRVKGNHDIAFELFLNREALDYSLDSLKLVDKYLDEVHACVKPKPHTGIRALFQRKIVERTPELDKTILWAGAYVGEVLRRLDPSWSWLDYDDYAILNSPPISELLEPKHLGVAAALVRTNGDLNLPINKVLRYVHEGSEHNTHLFVRTFLS
jgi:hypothetical protein